MVTVRNSDDFFLNLTIFSSLATLWVNSISKELQVHQRSIRDLRDQERSRVHRSRVFSVAQPSLVTPKSSEWKTGNSERHRKCSNTPNALFSLQMCLLVWDSLEPKESHTSSTFWVEIPHRVWQRVDWPLKCEKWKTWERHKKSLKKHN